MRFPYYISVLTLAPQWGVPLLDSMVGGEHGDECESLFMDSKASLPPPSSARKRRLVETVNLESFFCKDSDRATMPRFLIMSCSEENKTMKSVSAIRLAREIENSKL